MGGEEILLGRAEGAEFRTEDLGTAEGRDLLTAAANRHQGGVDRCHQFLARGQRHHPATQEVAEGQVAALVVAWDLGAGRIAGTERSQWQVLEGIGEKDVQGAGEIDGGLRRQFRHSSLHEVEQARPVGDPVAGQAFEVAIERVVRIGRGREVDAGSGEDEQIEERTKVTDVTSWREEGVPVIDISDHGVAQPEGPYGELQGHGGKPPTLPLKQHAPFPKHIIDDGRVDDARQVVVHEQPMVVEGHAFAGPLEQLGAGGAGSAEALAHPVVEANEGQVGLGHRQVFIIALVGDVGLAGIGGFTGQAAQPGKVEASKIAVVFVVEVGRLCAAHAQTNAIRLIKFRVDCRPCAVEGIQIQGWAAALFQLLWRYSYRSKWEVLGDITGQVMIHELTQVRIASGDVAVTIRGLGRHHLSHGLQQLLIGQRAGGVDDFREAEHPLHLRRCGSTSGCGLPGGSGSGSNRSAHFRSCAAGTWSQEEKLSVVPFHSFTFDLRMP